MSRRLGLILLTAAVFVVGLGLPSSRQGALGAEMDANAELEAKEATRLFKQGLYEDAAKLFAKLSVDYPDMLIFERNLGACFYYLRRPEPALSNLRHYLGHRKDITDDDKAVVERWIAEMEKARAQSSAVSAPPAVPFPPAGSTVRAAADRELPSTNVPPQVPMAYFPAPTPNQGATPPAAVNLGSAPLPSDSADSGQPFYAKWWFWTAVGAVAAGSVTAYLLVTRGGTQNACSGGTLPCDPIK